MKDQNKLKWKYDKNLKQWRTISAEGTSFEVFKDTNGYYELYQNHRTVGWFDKLRSAKQVAELIVYG